jgi:hypothetical protein
MEVDYSKGKIYKIYILGLDEIAYIGSTTIRLSDRLSTHKSVANSDAQYKYASCILFKEGNNPIIELIEDFPCENKAQLLEREQYWMDKYPNAINKNQAFLSPEEKIIKSREVCLKNYYKNQEQLIANNRKYKEEHKEEIAQQRADKYKALPQDEKDALNKANYERRKNIVLAKKKERVKCPTCNKEMNKNSLWEHKKKVHP